MAEQLRQEASEEGLFEKEERAYERIDCPLCQDVGACSCPRGRKWLEEHPLNKPSRRLRRRR
jgi:hypothetical protein